MDEAQQAALDAALKEVGEQPAEESATEPAKEEAEPQVNTEVSGTSEEKESAKEEPADAMSIYQKKLEAVMAAQRARFEEQQKQKQPDPQIEYLRRIEEALKSDKAQSKVPSLAELLSQPDDDKPDYVKALEQKVALYDEKLAEWEKQKQEVEQQRQIHQRQQWESNELGQIGKFIDTESETFPYVAALRPMNSDADLYNGMISMYNQGYSPSYKDMADLVETRIEGVLDHLAKTPKFQQWVNKRFGNQTPSQPQGTGVTLTGKDGAEPASVIDPSQLTEEESIALAIKAAKEAAESVRRRHQ